MITGGVVLVNLAKLDPAKFRGRLFAALAPAPAGVRATVIVGTMRVEPDAVRELRKQAERIDIEIAGEPHTVQRWLDALRVGLPDELDDPGGGRW